MTDVVNSPQRLAEDFDPSAPGAQADPYSVYGELRRTCPVGRSTHYGGAWLLSRYEDVHDAATRPDVFSSSCALWPCPENPVPFLPLESDPPDQARYRAPLQAWFSPVRMAKLEPKIRSIVTGLIDQFVDLGHCDLATDLVLPVPPRVIALLLGLPEEDWPKFQDMADRWIVAAAAQDESTLQSLMADLSGYLWEQLEARKSHPADDLLTHIVHQEAWDDMERLGITLFLLMAGHETTVGGTGMMLHTMALNPEVKERLVADPSLVVAAVEESLRKDPPVPHLARVLMQDTTVNGIDMHKGDKVVLIWASANHDESVFSDPEGFDLDRPNNRHLAFGAGIHRCLGAFLARLEMKVVLEEVLRRIPTYRIEDESQVRVEFQMSRCVKALPVVW
jgi:cytochrome P450